ncbi:MAG TPA: hypothetical protein VJ483_09035, partial [Holophagaceae bacterium]|nr:hypothetical protein [Holophagaceae bacterium]
MWHPTKEACRRLWGRRWVRRITYLLAGGAGAAWLGSTILEQPAVTRWAVGKADAYLREETGLSLGLGRLEVHPFFGTVVLEDLALGGDLLTIRRVDLRVDPSSFLTGQPRFYTVRITEPHGRLSPDRVARIRLKPHPDRKSSKVELVVDLLAVNGGVVDVLEPTWGIPKGHLEFSLKGAGQGVNKVGIALIAPKLELQGPRGVERGKLDLQADVSDRWIMLKDANVHFGASDLKAKGVLEVDGGQKVDVSADAALSLAQAFGWGRLKDPMPLTGNLRVQAQAAGTLPQPRWTLKLDGRDLRPGDARFAPGDLQLQAKGTLKTADLDRFVWASKQGRVESSGHWNGQEAALKLRLQDLSLEPLAATARTPLLTGVSLALDADVKLPTSPDRIGHPELWTAQAKARLAQNGAEAGGFTANLLKGRVDIPDLDLRLPDFRAQGRAEAQLDARGLAAFRADATVDADAGDVGDALDAWKIVDLDMDGDTQAKATVSWSRAAGLDLEGGAYVKDPAWHSTGADDLSATATIHGDRLEVKDILVHRNG